MSLADFIGRLTAALEAAGVEYMICGSVASFFHGVPRTTQDVDLVVRLDPGQVEALLAQLPEEQFYVSEVAAKDAARRRRQFNVIDLQTGWKADLIVQKDRAFSRVEFARRERVVLLGVSAWVASAEDTILAKLEWSARSGSDRQVEDARGVAQVQGETLDVVYLEEWAEALGLTHRLRLILG